MEEQKMVKLLVWDDALEEHIELEIPEEALIAMDQAHREYEERLAEARRYERELSRYDRWSDD